MCSVPVFCLLSGCTPESAQALANVFILLEIEGGCRPLVVDAIKAILSDDERKGQEEMTVIGAIGENGKLTSHIDGLTRDIALKIPDSNLRVIPRCGMGSHWYYGFIAPPDPSPPSSTSTTSYLVSYGTNIVVQSASLPILSLATNGRMTPYRLWRLAMWQGFSEGKDRDLLDGIDYGDVIDGIDQYMRPTPGIDDLVGLEVLGDVQRIMKTIVQKGKFWIWMRPDRFPIQNPHTTTIHKNKAPIHTEPPSNHHHQTPQSTFERLPYELISQIIHDLPLPSLLSTISTSRLLRSNFLRLASDRDALARSWISKSAPWYLPDDASFKFLISRNNDADADVDADIGVGVDDVGVVGVVGAEVVGWEYLKRCIDSGSMRNRRRIWMVAEQLEEMADRLGI